MSSSSIETSLQVQEHAERIVIGECCWEMFKQMWATGQIILPGEEWQGVRDAISAVSEHRPSRSVDVSRAQALIGRHAAAGSTLFNVAAPSRGLHLSFEADESVFSPTETSASLFLLHTVALARLEGKRVLDAFSGSGLLGVYAAARGASVVAYDTDEVAVACARQNASRNNVDAQMDVRQGDYNILQPNERFDVMAANPPLLPGVPTNDQPLSAAVFDPNLMATVDFVGMVSDHLTAEGRCYLLSSDLFDQDGRDVYSVCEQNDLQARLVIAMPRPTEWYRIHEIRHK